MSCHTKFVGIVAVSLASSFSLAAFAQDPARQDTNPIGGPAAGSSAPQGGGQSAQGNADAEIRQALEEIGQSPANAPERLFILMVATNNAWETEFSRVVEQKVQDEQIRQLAQTIRRDHEQAHPRLAEVAQRLNLKLPTRLSSQMQQKLEIFQAMSPEQLQTCYIVDMKADHVRAITSYSDHRQTIRDELLKQYISDALPKLQEHGTFVQQVAMAKQIGDSSSLLIGNADQRQDREMQRRASAGGAGSPGDTNVGNSNAAGSSGAGAGGSRTGSGTTNSGSSGTSGTGSSGNAGSDSSSRGGSGNGASSGTGANSGATGSGASGTGAGTGSSGPR
jgi:predicted outer membrane protein